MRLAVCPFCGSDAVAILPDDLGMGTAGGTFAYAHCDGCGAEGPPGDRAGEATERWNARRPPTIRTRARRASRTALAWFLGEFP